MTQHEFLEKWSRERPVYEAWGKHLVGLIMDRALSQVPVLEREQFFKIPPGSRVKSDVTMVRKAFMIKDYENPYISVTDKVGARFVVLLRNQLELLRTVISGLASEFEVSPSKDYEKEILEQPLSFNYQSIHFEVSPKFDFAIGELLVLPGMICEVQIRTLQQHANSELTHDRIYKRNIFRNPEMRRAAATSMALGEASDHLYDQVCIMVDEMKGNAPEILHHLVDLYEQFGPIDRADLNFNLELITAYDSFTTGLSGETITQFVASNQDLIQKLITKHFSNNVLYQQPAILLLLYLIRKDKDLTWNMWPLTEKALSPLYTHMGQAPPVI